LALGVPLARVGVVRHALEGVLELVATPNLGLVRHQAVAPRKAIQIGVVPENCPEGRTVRRLLAIILARVQVVAPGRDEHADEQRGEASAAAPHEKQGSRADEARSMVAWTTSGPRAI